MGGVCDLQCLWRALVSSSGLDSRQAECEVDDEEQSESCFFYLSSLSKGYWDSYKKGSMLGKCYRAATSISNGIFKPLNLSLNGSCE